MWKEHGNHNIASAGGRCRIIKKNRLIDYNSQKRFNYTGVTKSMLSFGGLIDQIMTHQNKKNIYVCKRFYLKDPDIGS